MYYSCIFPTHSQLLFFFMILLDIDGPPHPLALGSSGRLSHHDGHHWGLLNRHDLGVQLRVAALAADAAGHAGSHNAQDTRQPTEDAQVDEDHSQTLTQSQCSLRCQVYHHRWDGGSRKKTWVSRLTWWFDFDGLEGIHMTQEISILIV